MKHANLVPSSSPRRKKARLSNEASSSDASRGVYPARPATSAPESRQKRFATISAALGPSHPSTSAASNPIIEDETRDSLTNATNLPGFVRLESEAEIDRPNYVGPSPHTSQPISRAATPVQIEPRPDPFIQAQLTSPKSLSPSGEDDPFTPQRKRPLLLEQDQDAHTEGETLPPEPPIPANFVLGFATPRVSSGKKTFTPISISKEAIARAEETIARVEQDLAEPENAEPSAPQAASIRPPVPSIDSPSNARNTFRSPLISRSGVPRSRLGFGTTSLGTPTSIGRPGAGGSKLAAPSFSTPIRSRTPGPGAFDSPRAPVTPLPARATVAALSTPVSNNKTGGVQSARRAPIGRPAFVTPFKAGSRPGVAGRDEKVEPVSKPKVVPSAPTFSSLLERHRADKGKNRAGSTRTSAFFDISKKPGRVSLRKSNLLPGNYSQRDLVRLGIPIQIPMINADNALGYYFEGLGREPLNTDTARDRLLSMGCTLAKLEWVENHWVHIVWKRASMICCQPELFKEMWNFDRICQDLLYRYEREINRGQRPIIRMIQERDVSPARPMVLCISKIDWSPESMAEDGTIILPHPQFEVTDGWYFMRAQVDEPLARAARKKKVRVGTKIVVSGCSLDGKGEPDDVLKAYHSSSLVLTANSSTLARWDAKLGVCPPGPRSIHIATLASLNPDGGRVMLLDVVVTRLFTIGYVERLPDGKWGPARNEREEREQQDQWQVKRMTEEARLRADLEQRLSALQKVAHRAETFSNGWTPGPNDEEPNSLDDLIDDLEDAENPSELYRGLALTAKENGWLASRIHSYVEKKMEDAGQYVQAELDDECPPRNVTSFRIIVVRDARTSVRSGAFRTSQLTVKNVRSVEGLAVNQRYLVSNVMPTSPGAWPRAYEEGEIHLITSASSQWRRLPMLK